MPGTQNDRAPQYTYSAAPKPPGEPTWDASALDLAVTEAVPNPFDPIRAPYGGLRQRRNYAAPKTFAELDDHASRRLIWLEMWRWNPEVAFLVALIAGMVILGASIASGALTSTAQGKDVGFIWSLPWSIGALALYPVAIYLMIATLRWLPDILEEFSERGMLCTSEYQLGIKGTAVLERWTRPSGLRLLIIMGGALLIAAASIAFPPTGAGWPEHVGFRSLVVLWQIVAGSTFFGFVIYLTHFSQVLMCPTIGTGAQAKTCILVPDLSSPDVRRGFDLFEGVLQQLLMIGAIVFVTCNLVRIDAAYRSTQTTDPNLWAFISKTVMLGFTNPDHLSAVTSLFDRLDLNAGTVLSVMVASLTFLAGYYLLSGSVQTAAIRAARNARAYYRRFPDETLSGFAAAQEREALDKMKMRPLLFPTPYLLLSLFTVGVLAILFYGIGLYLFGITIVVMLSTVIVRFIRRK